MAAARALAAEGWTVTVGVREWMKPREHRVIDGVQFVGIESGHILKRGIDFSLVNGRIGGIGNAPTGCGDSAWASRRR